MKRPYEVVNNSKEENRENAKLEPLGKRANIGSIPSDVLQEQTKFVEDAEEFTKTGQGTDVVREYLEGNSDCNDILLLLYQAVSNLEATTIFNSLEVVLLRISDDLGKYIANAMDVVHRLLETFSRPIMRSLLFTNNSNTIKSSLRLLSAMATISRETANDVFSAINFSTKADLLKRTNSKDPQDVRTCFINLMVAFLMSDNVSLIANMIKVPEFTLIFQGLHADKQVVIETFLNAVVAKVVYNPGIGKTAKIALLGETNLRHVVKLLSWEGPKKYQPKKKSAAIVIDAETDGKELDDSALAVRSLAVRFLLEVCTHKNGILFKDDTLGTSDKDRNPVLSALLVHFKFDTIGNPMKEDFVITVLKSCPDQLVNYMFILENSMTPRPAELWINLMKFIDKIYDAQDQLLAFTIVSKSAETLPTKTIVNMTMNLLLPPLKLSQLLISAVQHSHVAVRREGLSYVLKSLKRMVRATAACEKCIAGESNLLGREQAKEFLKFFEIQFSKVLPTFEMLISIWDWFTGCNEEDEERKKAKPWTIADEQSDCVDGRVALGEDLVLVLDVCSVIGKLMPNKTEELIFSLKMMLSSIGGCQKWADVEERCIVQLRLLHLIHDFNLWQSSIVEMALVFRKLFVEILTNGNSSHQIETIQMMKCFFLANPQLVDHADEIEIWFYYLGKSSDKVELAKFLTECFAGIFSDDKEKGFHYDKRKNAAGNGESSTKLIKELIAYCNGEEARGMHYKSKERFESDGLSQMMCVVLEKMQDISTESASKYLTDVLTAVLHQHSSPNDMIDVLSKGFMNGLPETFKKYMRSLAANQDDSAARKKFKPRKCKDADSILRYAFACRFKFTEYEHDGCEMDEVIEEMISEGNHVEVCLVAKQILFYTNHILDSHRSNLKVSADATEYFCSVFRGMLKALADKLSSEFTLTNTLVKSLAKILFRHPVVDACFSLDVFQHENPRFAKAIEGVFRTVLEVADILGPNVGDVFTRNLSDKILDFVCGALKLRGNEVEDDLLATLSLSRIVSTFLRNRPVKSLVKLAKKVVKAGESSDMPVGNLLAAVLDSLLKNPEASSMPVLREKLVRKCFQLCGKTRKSSGKFEMEDESNFPLHAALLKLLKIFPLYSYSASEELFFDCLQIKSSAVEQHLACALLGSNANFHEKFENWCLLDASRKILRNRIDVVVTYLQILKINGRRRTEMTEDVLKCLFKLGWNRSCDSVFKNVNISSCKMMSLFHELQHSNGAVDNAKMYFLEKFKLHVKSKSGNNYEQLASLAFQIFDSDENFIFVALKLLTNMLKADDGGEGFSNTMRVIVHNLTIFFKRAKCTEKLEETARKFNWKKYVKNSLKYSLSGENIPQSKEVLDLLTRILKFLSKTSALAELVAFSEVHFLLVNHSKFLPEMLDDTRSCPGKKGAILDLITLLVQRYPSLCKSNHVPVFLGAYGATLNPVDRKLLRLLCIYEQNGIDMYTFRPFLWGEAAVNRYISTKSSSLWKQPSPEEVLNLLDSHRVMTTALKFPVDLPLDPYMPAKLENESNQPDTLYDPRFLIPLLSHIFSPESYVPFKSCMSSNVLTLVFGALKSCDENVRVAAYQIVKNLYEHLEGSKYPLRTQLIHILDCLRNGISTPNMRISSVVSAFLIHLIASLSKTNFYMTKMILDYMHRRPVLQLFEVPNLNGFFFSNDVKQYECRKWIMEVMAHGLDTMSDFEIYKDTGIIQMLMTYCVSTLSDAVAKAQVLSILKAAIKIPGVAAILCSSNCLISFLQGLVQHGIHVLVLPEFVNLTCKVWNTILHAGGSKELKKKSFCVVAKQFSTLLLLAIYPSSLRMDCATLQLLLSALSRTLNIAKSNCPNQNGKIGSKLATNQVGRLLELHHNSFSIGKTSSEELGKEKQRNQLVQCTNHVVEIIFNWDSTLAHEKCSVEETAKVFTDSLKFVLHCKEPGEVNQLYMWKVMQWAREKLHFVESVPQSKEIATELLSAVFRVLRLSTIDILNSEVNHFVKCNEGIEEIVDKILNILTQKGNGDALKTVRSWMAQLA